VTQQKETKTETNKK